ncbi:MULTISPECIES: WecB/TagA/CpsF family glycosyltransferase [Methylococcus]|uniref:WecB/TagA/CpsF family glycosyltransferase n=1 Tax=Methylococcus TaxID=413 RepID=UPI001C52ED1F|nr:WecB/TagA/CpsF family glycosyltransferase [Methylococcus capsulatus]QXP90780.1 WecB/TagA/CpsF family glycosyltransferase [Methylococcus capsulatus]
MARHTAIPGPLGKRPLWHWRLWLLPLLTLVTSLLPRIVDCIVAGALLILLAPLLLLRALVAKLRAGRVFAATERVGRFQVPFRQLAFADDAPARDLAVLLNVLWGDMAFAGPRPLSPEEAAAVPASQSIRFRLRPGIFSPYTLRSRIGIAYEGEGELDREFYYTETAAGNLGLMLRTGVGGLVAGDAIRPAPDQLEFFGVAIANTTMSEAIDWIVRRVREDRPATIAFVNPDCLNIAYGNPEYREVLGKVERVLPDGIGIRFGCRILGTSLRANVNGTDMFPRLCERCAHENLSLFLLGARPGVARQAAENMLQRYPNLKIVGSCDGYFAPDAENEIIETINRSGADILLVAFGVPKQELWLWKHRSRLKPRVAMGVGGLFDFYSGRIPRAPLWLREIGLEWSWRLLQEPGRMWRRYIIGNPLFLYRVWRQKIGKLTL